MELISAQKLLLNYIQHFSHFLKLILSVFFQFFSGKHLQNHRSQSLLFHQICNIPIPHTRKISEVIKLTNEIIHILTNIFLNIVSSFVHLYQKIIKPYFTCAESVGIGLCASFRFMQIGPGIAQTLAINILKNYIVIVVQNSIARFSECCDDTFYLRLRISLKIHIMTLRSDPYLIELFSLSTAFVQLLTSRDLQNKNVLLAPTLITFLTACLFLHTPNLSFSE